MQRSGLKSIRRADLWLVLVLLAAAGLCFALLRLTASSGGIAVVAVDGHEIGRYPLSRDTKILIPGYNGGENTLVIRDGTACISEADCPDKLCVRSGMIRYEGECIICLPHRVIVTVEGGEPGEGDAG